MHKEVEQAENKVRQQLQEVAKLRKQMPPEKVKNYRIRCTLSDEERSLSEAFGDKSEMIVIHNMGGRCPGCTAWADGFNGIHHHVRDRVAFLVTSNDAVEDQRKLRSTRGWTFPMASVKGTSFTADMGFTAEDKGFGPYRPGISVFKKTPKGEILRTAQATICPNDEYSPIFQLLNLTEAGSEGWFPKFSYPTQQAESMEALIGKYYGGWSTGNFDAMEAVLAPNLKFQGPMNQFNSSKELVDDCRKMAKSGAFDRYKVTGLKQIADGNEAFTFYELTSGKDKPIPMAEYFRADNGKISEIKVYFDPTRFQPPGVNA